MREVIGPLLAGWREDAVTGLATVVGFTGSSPRPVGTSLLVRADGSVTGSLSGGCVDAAVYELAGEVVRQGRPRLERYGVVTGDVVSVGLPCGGEIEVFVEPVSRGAFPELEQVAADLAAERPVAVATVVEHPDPALVGDRVVARPGGLVTASGLRGAMAADAAALLADGTSATVAYDARTRVFVRSVPPRPRLVVVGAVDVAAALAALGGSLGFRVTVCDPRPVFATPDRVPTADEVVRDRPEAYLRAEHAAGRLDSRSAVAVLSHDPRFDVPALAVALRLPQLAFVGAMGSRRTDEDRRRRLLEAGLGKAELAALHSPIGLDLGGRTPPEIALSILAELTAVRHGASGRPLRDLLPSGARVAAAATAG